MVSKEVEKILPLVQKPGRYIGGELNSVIKDKEKVALRYAFCFPDSYEIGMSHLGMKILYSIANEREDVWCERVFAPWHDMEAQMRKHSIPLYALESGDAIRILILLHSRSCMSFPIQMCSICLTLPVFPSERRKGKRLRR